MDLTKLSATQLLDQLKSGDLSAADCTEFFLRRIEANQSLNAFVDVGENGSGSLAKSAALARTRAAAIDARLVCSNALFPVTMPPVLLS